MQLNELVWILGIEVREEAKKKPDSIVDTYSKYNDEFIHCIDQKELMGKNQTIDQ